MSSPGNACPVAFPIATVNVRNLDDDVVDCLKWCASSNESSRKGEVRHMREAPPTPGPRRLWTGSVRKLGVGVTSPATTQIPVGCARIHGDNL